MIPFYVNVAVHLVFIIMFMTILPESLSSDARTILAKNAALARDAVRRRDAAEREWENEAPTIEVTDPLLGTSIPAGDSGWSRISHAGASRRRKRFVGNMTRLFRTATKPLTPLAIFMPQEKEDGQKDWNLFWVGVASFTLSMMMVSSFPCWIGKY